MDEIETNVKHLGQDSEASAYLEFRGEQVDSRWSAITGIARDFSSAAGLLDADRGADSEVISLPWREWENRHVTTQKRSS